MTAAERQRHTLLSSIIAETQEGLLQNIRWLVPTLEDAEDILQDVLYRLTDSFDDIRSLDKATAWLYRVARNRVTDWYRNRSASPQISEPGGSGDDRYLLEEMLPDMSGTPESAFMRRDVGEAIDEALSTLPAKQREVFVWHEIEGHSFEHIAQRTGRPLNTLLSQKRYAVLELRSQLKELTD